MNLEVNQSNLYLFLPSKACWVANMIADAKGISIAEAISEFYSSDVYKRLEDEQTKLWHLGPVALYQEIE